MTPGTPIPAPQERLDYLREVRRVRARYAHDPAARTAQLRLLARRQDAAAQKASPKAAPAPSVVTVRRVQPAAALKAPLTPPPTSPVASTNRARETFAEPVIAPGVLAVPREVAELFLTEISARLEGDVLRYTARRELLERAARIGISRFDANLLIASALHAVSPDAPAAHAASRRRTAIRQAGFPWLTLFYAVLAGAAAWLSFAK